MLSDTLGFYSVKASAIFIVAIIYFILGTVMSILLDELSPEENYDQMTTLELFFHISIMLGVIAVVFYFIRIMLKRVPFFMNGWYGFEASRLREISGGIIIAHTVYTYQTRLVKMMEEFGRRMRRVILNKKNV
jgi:hypothetical protein